MSRSLFDADGPLLAVRLAPALRALAIHPSGTHPTVLAPPRQTRRPASTLVTPTTLGQFVLTATYSADKG
jgi:hypothetical protein